MCSCTAGRPLARAGRGRLEDGQDVLLHRQLAEDGRLLRQVADAAAGPLVHPQAGDVLAVRGARGRRRRDEADDHVEGRGLAGPVRAEEADHLARADPQVDPVDDRAASVGLGESLGDDRWGARHQFDGAPSAGGAGFSAGNPRSLIAGRRMWLRSLGRPLDDGAALPPVEDHPGAARLVVLALDLHDRVLGEDDAVLAGEHLGAPAGRDPVRLDDPDVARRQEVLEAVVLPEGRVLLAEPRRDDLQVVAVERDPVAHGDDLVVEDGRRLRVRARRLGEPERSRSWSAGRPRRAPPLARARAAAAARRGRVLI
jgi:hypothetical protein